MTDFFDPVPADEAVYDRNGVRRHRTDGRPYVKVPCPNADPTRLDGCNGGRVPGKREGTTKQCPKCKGAGGKEVLYTRCTTFVGALEDRQNLETWKIRTALLGVAADYRARAALLLDHRVDDGSLLGRLLAASLDDIETLSGIAHEAFEAGDGFEKAQKGTDKHFIMECVDLGDPLPEGATLADRVDAAAWLGLQETYGIEHLDVEVFVVCDELKIGGTYDRRSTLRDPAFWCEACGDGPEKVTPKIVDLKSGRVDYGGGKMRQQLALYANSRNYDPVTGKRADQDVCTHLGFIFHLAADTGVVTPLACDLVAGWSDVQLSAAARRHRSETRRGALSEVVGMFSIVPAPAEDSLEFIAETP